MKLKMDKNLLIKLIASGVIGLIIIVGGILFVFSANWKSKQVTTEEDSQEETQEIEVDDEEVTASYARVLAVIESVDTENDYIKILNTDDETEIRLKVDSSVEITDEYGTDIVLDNLSPGYMVNVKYDEETFEPTYIKIAAQIQTLTNISSFTVQDDSTIAIGSDSYDYDDKMIILKNGEETDLSDVDLSDSLEIRAYDGKIWSILIDGGHGYLTLLNDEGYIGGLLEIGNRTSYTITEDLRVSVSVGDHDIVITNDNMDPYTGTIQVVDGQEYTIDLVDYQAKKSEVTFDIAQEDVTVYVDGEAVEDPTTAQEYDYGTYTVTAEKDDYETWEGTMTVNQPTMTVEIDMEENPSYVYISGPEGAQFYVDSTLQGELDGVNALKVAVTEGSHLLTLRKDGYNSWSKSVTVEGTGKDYYYTVSELTPIGSSDDDDSSSSSSSGSSDNTTSSDESLDTPTEDVYDQ